MHMPEFLTTHRESDAQAPHSPLQSSPVMAGRAPSCAFPHDGHNPIRSAILAITSLVAATSPASSLLGLLGETDATLQDWMMRGHPYAFNLGGTTRWPPTCC